MTERELARLVHFIIARLGPIDADTIKVVLWRMDVLHYRRTGEGLTGLKWIKGPSVPEPVLP